MIYYATIIQFILITYIFGLPLKVKNGSETSQKQQLLNGTGPIDQLANIDKPPHNPLPLKNDRKHTSREELIEIKDIDAQVLVKGLNTLTILKMKDVQPPDHLDGAPIENDGHLNPDFRREIIIGHHMEFEEKKDQNPEETLKRIFKLADTNGDGFLSVDELNTWMVGMVESHLKDTEVENEEIFTHLDINKNGRITWEEFNIHFLLAKGYSLEKAVEISKGDAYNEAAILPEEKERLIRYKFRWVEADESGLAGEEEEGEDGEGEEEEGLDKRELMNFRHPEQSPSMIMKVAIDLLEKFDSDEDGIITEDEFVEPPKFFHGQDYEPEADKMINERRLEFHNFIDLDRDGMAELEELKVYVDPRNRNRMRVEAENLMMLADDNGDRRLSLPEVQENAELILGSKMVDASKNFHDEF